MRTIDADFSKDDVWKMCVNLKSDEYVTIDKFVISRGERPCPFIEGTSASYV